MSDIVTLNGYKIKDEKAVRSYDTVALMKADTKLKEGYHVKTKGYYETNDGGHGEYVIVDDETLVDDGGSIHVLNNGLRAKLVYNQFANVKQFGAYGNGINDDTSAIQSAINEYKTVYIPKGNYVISNSLKLKNELQIIGENVSNTIIICDDDISAIEKGDSANYVNIKNLTLTNNNLSTKYAIDIKGSITSPYTGSTYSNFENIIIDGFESGMFFNHIWNTNLNKIRVKNCTTNGIYLGGGCNNIKIDMPMLENLICGIRITSSDIDTTQSTNITINNGDIEYCTTGIYLYNDETISINELYTEHNSTNVYAYSTKGLKIDGFYSSFDTKVGDFSNSNVSVLNGFIRVNSDNDIGIISSNNFININNIVANNNGTGKVFCLSHDVNTYIPLIYSTLPYNVEGESFRLRYSSDKYDGVFNTKENNDNQYSCYKPCLVITSNDLVATSGDQINLLRNGNVIASLSINNGDSLIKDSIIEFTSINTSAKNFIYNNGDEYSIQHTNSTGVDVNFKIVFKDIKTGKFILN